MVSDTEIQVSPPGPNTFKHGRVPSAFIKLKVITEITSKFWVGPLAVFFTNGLSLRLFICRRRTGQSHIYTLIICLHLKYQVVTDPVTKAVKTIHKLFIPANIGWEVGATGPTHRDNQTLILTPTVSLHSQMNLTCGRKPERRGSEEDSSRMQEENRRETGIIHDFMFSVDCRHRGPVAVSDEVERDRSYLHCRSFSFLCLKTRSINSKTDPVRSSGERSPSDDLTKGASHTKWSVVCQMVTCAWMGNELMISPENMQQVSYENMNNRNNFMF